jgi:hypothetical protein
VAAQPQKISVGWAAVDARVEWSRLGRTFAAMRANVA